MTFEERIAALAYIETLEKTLQELTKLVSATEPAPTPSEPAPAPPHGLADPAAFFAYVRTRDPLGPSLTQDEVDGCNRILGACADAAFPVSWAAYVLATAFHETAGTLKPVREYGRGDAKPYGQPGPHGGQAAYGRGDCQLTWPDNYARMDAELGLDGALIANYDLALDPEISKRIIVRGMGVGIFTGKSLNDYLPAIATIDQFKAARRIVNGTDRAVLIASYASTFQAGLMAGRWA